MGEGLLCASYPSLHTAFTTIYSELTWFNVTFKISEIGGETMHYFAYMLKIGVRLPVTSNAIPPAPR